MREREEREERGERRGEKGEIFFMTKEKLVAQMFPVKFKVALALGVGMFLG